MYLATDDFLFEHSNIECGDQMEAISYSGFRVYQRTVVAMSRATTIALT